MNLSIFTDNDVVTVDGYQLVFDLSKFDLPEKLWAVFWDGQSGHIEYTDDRPHEDITDVTLFQAVVDEHARLKDGIEHPPPLPESERLARLLEERDDYLAASDWLIVRHKDQIEQGYPASLSDDDYQAIQDWRQALRDLPETVNTPDEWEWPDKPECIDH